MSLVLLAVLVGLLAALAFAALGGLLFMALADWLAAEAPVVRLIPPAARLVLTNRRAAYEAWQASKAHLAALRFELDGTKSGWGTTAGLVADYRLAVRAEAEGRREYERLRKEVASW